MLDFLKPVWTFLVAQVFALILFLFFPALGATETQLAADTAAWSGIGWGWSWITTSGFIRWFFLVLYELAVLFICARMYLHPKR